MEFQHCRLPVEVVRRVAAGKAAVPMLPAETGQLVPRDLCSLQVVQTVATIARSRCRHTRWAPVAVMVNCLAYPMVRRLVVVTLLAAAPKGPVLIFEASMLHPGPREREVGSLPCPRLQMACWRERHPIPRAAGVKRMGHPKHMVAVVKRTERPRR